MNKPDDDAAGRNERLAKLAALPDDGIDTSDIPEAPPGSWAKAATGRFFRPKQEAVTIRLDADLLDWFRHQAGEGPGYQAAINAALRIFVTNRRQT